MSSDLETWVRWLTFLPIVAASVVGLGVTLWKWLQLRSPNLPAPHVMIELRQLLLSSEFRRAMDLAKADAARGSQITAVVTPLAGRSRALITDQATQRGRALARELEYGLGGLSLIATLGPLLGLFGTVVGIVLVFNRLAALEGLASPQQLASGIGTALYTTVAGLSVGMMALVAHRYLAARVDRAIGELEALGHEMVNLVASDVSLTGDQPEHAA